MDHKLLNDGLLEAMIKIGINKKEKEKRNIVFHSWRHRYASKMADLVDARSLGLATGHKRWRCLNIMPPMRMRTIPMWSGKQQREPSAKQNKAASLRGESDSKQRFSSRFPLVIEKKIYVIQV